MTRDSVCLTTVHPNHAAAMLEFGGRSYYFCSQECRDKFKEQLQSFLNKTSDSRFASATLRNKE